MRTEALRQPPPDKRSPVRALQRTKHVAKLLVIALLLLATAIVVYVAA